MGSTDRDIEGKVAVITGGGGALCGAISEGLAAEGTVIALLDLDEEAARTRAESIRSAGGNAAHFVCDVTDERQVAEVERSIVKQLGQPRFLINGAGGNDSRATTDMEFLEAEHLDSDAGQSLYDIGIEDFRGVFDLNFHGTFIPSRVFSRGMVKDGGGAIVNISSMTALTPLTKVVAYGAAKAAVANLTKWLAVHFSKVGIRVNALAPGFFMTEQLRFLHVNQQTGEYTPRAKKVVEHTPLGRYGDPDELVGTVKWLLSEDSRFVTGVVVPIDGGFSSYAI